MTFCWVSGLATCRTFRLFRLSCPYPTLHSTHRKKHQSKEEPKAEGTVGRLLYNLSAISHDYFEGQNGQMEENMWKPFKNCNSCETQAAVGTDVPWWGLPESSHNKALSWPTMTRTVFLWGCYSPVSGPAQAVPAPGNSRAFSGPSRLWSYL